MTEKIRDLIIFFQFKRNSEVSSESMSSRTRTSSNTPETSSNGGATTSSSKISKTDDENEEIVKIQVIDDYLSKTHLTAIKYGAQYGGRGIGGGGGGNNNFSYAGSFSSIGSSSYESSPSEDLNMRGNNNNLAELAANNNNNMNNEHGLYSVKMASIQFNSVSQQQSNNCAPANLVVSDVLTTLNDYDIFETRERASVNRAQLQNSSPGQQQQQQPNVLVNPKTSSLKKLKKEIALKKSINNLNNSNGSSSHTTVSPPSRNSPFNAPINVINSSSMEDKAIYEYLSSNQILLNPNHIIASVV
jgi:hypothetical protein